jgi:hypothetical protein
MSDPTIYPRSESGIRDIPDSKYGKLGNINAVTIHHSAGPRAPTKARCQELNRSYQIYHQSKGWVDIGYHFCMDDLGRFYRLRPHWALGAHVGGWNTGNIGIMVHGNYVNGLNEVNQAQRESLRWLFQGGFYKLFGEPEAGIHLVRGHQEWPGHNTNACPGHDIMRYLTWLRSVEDY